MWVSFFHNGRGHICSFRAVLPGCSHGNNMDEVTGILALPSYLVPYNKPGEHKNKKKIPQLFCKEPDRGGGGGLLKPSKKMELKPPQPISRFAQKSQRSVFFFFVLTFLQEEGGGVWLRFLFNVCSRGVTRAAGTERSPENIACITMYPPVRTHLGVSTRLWDSFTDQTLYGILVLMFRVLLWWGAGEGALIIVTYRRSL